MGRPRCRSWVFAAGLAMLAAAGGRAGEAPAAGGGEEIVVAHFGDSTSACSYLKPEERVDAVLNKLLPQVTKPPMFLTITYKGLNKRTKTYTVQESEKGFAQYKHLLKGIDLNEYQWFEEVRI